MKKLKLLTIMAAATVVSASVYASPVFAADENNNTDVEITAVADNAAEENTEAIEEDVEEEAAEEAVEAYADGAVSVSLSVSEAAQSNCLNPTFTVTNNGSSDLDLSTVVIKYFYTADFAADATDTTQSFNCYYAGTTNGNYQALTSNVKGTVNSATGSDTDSVLEVSFTGGTLAAGQTMQVQANVNKANWSDYNHSNDFSYNNAENIVVEVNGDNVYGTYPGKQQNQAKFTNGSSADYDVFKPADVNIGINFNGTSLTSITGLNASDYTTTSNGVTVNKSALASLTKGQSKVLTLNFSEGKSLTFTINAVSSEIVLKPVLVNTSSTMVEKHASNTNVGMTLNGKTLTSITGNGITSNDYTVNGSTATIKQEFLNTLKANTNGYTFMFNFSDGTSLPYKVIVTPDVSNNYNLTVDLGSAAGKVGESVSLPVTITGITSDPINGITATLKYDPAVLENVTVTPGSMIPNVKKTFLSSVKADGTIKLLFADSTGEDLETLASDGVFVTINATIKAGAPEGKNIAVTGSADSCFSSVSDAECVTTFTSGDVTVKDNSAYLTIGNADTEVVAGNTVVVPVSISGITADKLGGGVFKFKYDTNLFEDVTVTPGNIASAKYFSKTINKDTGVVSILYSDPGDGTALIANDGVFFNVSLKAKNVTVPTLTKFVVTDEGSFADGLENDYKVAYEMGKINITPGEVKYYDSTLKTGSVAYDVTNKADQTVGINLNGNTFTGIVGLTNGTDYTVNAAGDEVTLKQSYLDSLGEGADKDLTFEFSHGASASLNVTTNVAPKPDGLTFNFAGVEKAEAGTTITVPVSVSGITADQLAGGVFKFKYDTNLFENVKITAGSIVTNKACFSKTINKTTGAVSILYSDPGDGTGAIATDGTLFNMTLTVKADAPTTTSKFVITDEGSFADLNEKDYTVSYNVGAINVVAAGGGVITPVQNSVINPTSVAYDVNNKADQTVGITLNGNKLDQIVGLTAGTDYTVNAAGDQVTLKQSYLDTLGQNATKDLVFKFNQGNDQTLTVTTNEEISKIYEYQGTISSAAVKAGDTFTVDVNLGGTKLTAMPGAQFYASYDSNLLEVVDLQAGDIVADPDADFACDYSKAGSIKVTFMEGSFDEDLYINQAGTFAKITFKVKDNAAAGTTKINVTDAGLGISLTDENLKAIKNVPVSGGVITIA